MKRLILILSVMAILVALTTLAFATEIPAGPVTGHWYATENPYNINGEIYVPSDSSLYIHEGVLVIFQEHYKFRVDSNATLQAVGTINDSILFTAADTSNGWNKLFFYKVSDSSSLSHCIFEYSKSNILTPYIRGGGAIEIDTCNPYFTFCTFRYNKAIGSQMNGGAIVAYYSYSLISNCIFYSNYATHTGGGFAQDTGGEVTLENCLFENNTCGQSHGSAIRNVSPSESSHLIIRNCTIVNNPGASQVNTLSPASTEIRNSIIWYYNALIANGNFVVSYSDIQGGWPGTTNIDSYPLFIPGPFGNYYLQQQPCQPLPQSPCVNAGDPASSMITGTTRTDGVQDAGIVDMGYHYPLSLLYSIVLTPANPPIIVPANGGSFSFDVTLHNNSDTVQTFDVWTTIQTPQNVFVPSLGPFTLSFPAGFSLSRTRTQTVPPFAPAGDYIYWGYVGDYPWVAVNSDSFTFTKSATGEGMEGPFSEWLCSGESFPGEENQIGGTCSVMSPSDATKRVPPRISPNPFNPSTVISYKLQATSRVSLRVYDTAGRLVETLVGGWREAGEHEVTFDGSALPSGVYLYRLEVTGSGTTSTTVSGKMVLLK